MKPSIFKKMVSIILSCAMCFPMFSTNIFANTNDVVSGYYDNNGNWKQGELVQTLPEGINSINKSATKIDKNKYKINLKVVTEQNKVTSSKEAATVLVIDTSGSMKDESRMANAKKAAKDFIDTYAGKEVGSGRYVAVVDFATEGKVALGWTDVATENGKKAAKNAINSLKANGGTNLHAGLKYASTLLSDSKVNEIDSKNSIVLTDGAPTYYLEKCDCLIGIFQEHNTIGGTKYDIEGNGKNGSKKINEATAAEATNLRAKSKVYTVCYGAGNDKTYKNGPTVGEFLEGSIASKNCAYNVDNASELNEIFENITNTIISGIDGKELEVVDKLTEFISVSGLPTNITSDGSGFTWKLSDTKPTISTNGNKTIYTYELEYIVTIDADNAKFEEGKYYPLNGDTYIMVNGQKVKFPIPAAKGEKTMCTVTYTDGVNEDVVFEEQSKTVKIGEKTPEFTGKLERKGYVFVGWSPKVEETVTKDVIYVAQWEKDENGNGKPDKEERRYQVAYTDGVDNIEIFKDQIYKDLLKDTETPKFKGENLSRDGYIFAGWSPEVSKTVERNAVYTALWDRDINGNNVPDKEEKYTVTYTDGVEEELFNVQFKDLEYGTSTPKFTGKLERKGYIFAGWSPEVSKTVERNAVYTALWDRDINGNGVPDKNEDLFYTIKYEDGVEAEKLFDVKFEKVEYGKPTPNFTGKLERKGYVFAGWNPKVSETVTGNATYVATWDRDENENGVPDKKETKYKVVYTDGVENEVVFENQKNEVLKGLKTPEFKGGKPERKGYIFAGWSPEVSKTVERNAVYTALWDRDINGNNVPDKEEKYTVTYTDGVEEELFNVQFKDLEYGTSTPKFTGKLERKGYIFAGWSPEVSKTVERNAVYTALWDRDINGNGKPDKDEDLLFTVTYDDGLNEDFFNVKFENVEYGTSTPKFEGNLNVKGYIFKGWSPEIAEKVTRDATYVAQWDRDENGNNIPDDKEKRYTVTYTDGVENEVVFKDEVTTGLFVGDLTPEFKQGGEKGIPTRTGYVFMGWSPKPSYIIKAEEKEQIVYTATWEVDKNGDNRPDKDQPYKITYTDGVEGKEVFADQVSEALYGDITPVFNGTPTRSGYKFKGWEPKVADTVTGDATYVAQWEEEYIVPPTPPTPPVKPDGGDGDRIEGHDRIETAIEASKDLYPGGTNAVVLANCERYTDVLTANPFAVQEKASVLFTYLDKLPEKTLREIERLGVKKIYISGGYEAVSKKVVDQLRDRGYEIYRFDGENRYDTARKIAIKMREKGNTKVVELASGENYPDALSMTSMAVKDNAPILLTKKDSIPMYTKKALAEWDIETVKIAGLNEAISKEVEKQIDKGFSIVKGNKEDSNIYDGALSVLRYGGANRYETSTVIAAATYPESRTGVYATGENFPDALVAGNYAGIKKAPVLLVKRDSLPSVVKQYNENSNIRRAVVVGGVNAISDYVFDLIKLSIK